mmetsp:Transcript_1880/g.3838  ORF Transcript_1880/g.3838 Transcript_1880/m.3838 type:complete len:725 (+) Transcript_1880:326-2500(+)
MLEDQNVSRIQVNYVPENEVKHEKAGARCISSIWWAFTRLITLYVPDAYFEWRGESDKDARQAWREKVAIFVVMILFSAVFVGVGGLLPLIACDDTEVFEYPEGGGVSVSINKENLKCTSLKIIMYSITTVISVVLVIQCVCSLLYIARKKPDISNEKSNVLVMVPCYNEGEKELSKTFESVLRTRHPSRNKVLVVVADGIIQGNKEPKTTPEFIADELGYSKQLNNENYIGTFDCTSVGEHATNKAHLYCGSYTKFENELKYIVVVKCGLQEETNADKPGNRGKRDSQLLIIGMLNRFHHRRPLTDLDRAVIGVLKNKLSMPLETVKYLMAIDADTKVHRDSLSNMIYSMNKDETILALCGETRVENKRDSWVTWIQVFEYYTNHHMKKAFESVFGCVTCLPGCFTMYRLFTEDNVRLLSCDQVYQRYATNKVKSLHEKNLFHLGEDRMLTTLLLETFPGMKLSFVPEAICYTIVPKSFMVLLSQRRRWINSTFHNLLELLRVGNMPTVCCVSMKALIALDLVATLILPASLIYIFVNIYFTVILGEAVSTTTLIVLGISIGVQVLPFLLRSDFTYIGWFIIYMIFGVPVFYFILPLYSFSKMDDFSWGTTRQVDESTTPDSMDSDVEVGASPHRGHGEGFEIRTTGHQSPRRTVRTPTNLETHDDYGRNTTNAASTSDSRDGNQPPRHSIPEYLNLNTGDFNEDEMNEMLSNALDDAPVVPV